MKYYILGGLIALAVVAYSWISGPAKINESGDEMIWIGHKTIEIPSDVRTNQGTNWLEFKPLKPLPTNLVVETDGEHFRIVDPKSPLGHWIIIGERSQYFSSNDAIRAYWELHEYLEEKKSKRWKEVKP